MVKHSKATKLFAAVLAILMVLAVTPATAFAATRKSVKNSTFTTKIATIQKKATTVKKGTTTLKYRGNEGWLMFKAPKTKTYTFSFSNFKNSKGSYGCYVSIHTASKYNNKSIVFTDAKTQGGKADALWFTMNGNKPFDSSKPATTRRASRYAKIKLKANQKIYFYTYGVDAGSAKLVIK